MARGRGSKAVGRVIVGRAVAGNGRVVALTEDLAVAVSSASLTQPTQGEKKAFAEPAVQDEVGCCLEREQQLGDGVELCELCRLDVVVIDANDGCVDDVRRLADEEDEHDDDQHQCYLQHSW